ncbi:MAG: hypothetical protein CSB48_05750 [Proteobacteria bacterium]|nr:MAG: hypothetical protein CSB48_05750 [Pseudomonadota bacterium]
MRNQVIEEIKDLFRGKFTKKLKHAETYEELRRELNIKRQKLRHRLKHTRSKSEKKLIEKKIKILGVQIKKIDSKLD